MFQAGPHVHGDGAQLDLHRQLQRTLRDHDGHLHDQVQAAIAGLLRLPDVVGLADDAEGFRPRQQATKIVNVVQIVADNPQVSPSGTGKLRGRI